MASTYSHHALSCFISGELSDCPSGVSHGSALSSLTGGLGGLAGTFLVFLIWNLLPASPQKGSALEHQRCQRLSLVGHVLLIIVVVVAVAIVDNT